MRWQPGIVFAAALSVYCLAGNLVGASHATPSAAVPGRAAEQGPDDPAFRAFHAAVAEYIRLQQRLRAEAPLLVVSSDPRAISNASNVLAGAIQRARAQAKQGTIFDPAATAAITARLKGALSGTDVVTFVTEINDEPTFKGPPRVHMRFPGVSSLATMPANILEALPPLPEQLEYRFVGRDLILRDRDAALVLDYVTRALPPK